MCERTSSRALDGIVSRRCALRLGAVSGTALLAGCTEDVGEELPANAKRPVSASVPDLPVRERTDVVADRIEALAATDVTDPDDLEAAVEDRGLEVESLERVADVLDLAYVDAGRNDAGTLQAIGSIAGAYASLVDSGTDSTALGITILDEGTASYGAAEVEAAWAERFTAGELSTTEYGELVATTIESTRHRPGVEVEPEE